MLPIVNSTLLSWVFMGVAPVVLDPGTYVVAASYNGSADLARLLTTATTSPAITFVSNRQEASSGLVFPTDDTLPLDDGFFGPNLQVRVISEPGALLSLGSGLMLLSWLDRRRRCAVGQRAASPR